MEGKNNIISFGESQSLWTFQETLQGFRGSCKVLEASEGSKRVLEVLGGTRGIWRVLVGQYGLGGSWRIWNSLGGYRKVLESLLWSRKVKVQRESRKVLNGVKKPVESGTVFDGLLGSGRVKGGLGGSEQA